MVICNKIEFKSLKSFCYNNFYTICRKHNDNDMQNNRHDKCMFKSCKKLPSYGIEKSTHCLEHKTEEMEHLNSKKCEFSGCKTTAGYGKFSATHCKNHK